MFRFSITVLLLLVSCHAAQAAPPKLSYLVPAGAERGRTATVEAAGSYSNWPAQIWVDRPGISVEAAEKKGELTVKVDPEAECGVYWLRLHDKEGATVLRPFIVGNLQEVAEDEDNNAPGEAQPLAASAVVNGRLSRRGDVDGFAMQLAAGQTLVASMQANQVLGSPMDAVLQVCTPAGFVLAQNDDASGIDPLLVYEAPADGQYIVRTFAFPETPTSSIRYASGDSFVYRLTLTTGPLVDHALPLAAAPGEQQVRLFGWRLDESASSVSTSAPEGAWSVNVFHPQAAGHVVLPVVSQNPIAALDATSLETPQPVELPAIVSGRIDKPKDADVFAFQATKGQKLSLRLQSWALGYPLDAVLSVVDDAGKTIEETDDASRRRDPALTFTAPADGRYRATVRDLHGGGGLRYVYRLKIEQQTPRYRLELAGGEFTLTPGKPLEIPVTIDRESGFAETVEITASNLPEGVSAEAAISEPKGGSAKSVKLKLTAESGSAAGPIQIVGQVAEQSEQTRVAEFSVAGQNAVHRSVWLTVAAAKDDDKE